jgi:putative transcriptional regulator
MKNNATNPPKSGDLLISEPFLQDENFVRSVILICENNENGSFGLVLNKQSILKLSDLVDGADFLDAVVYVGGPVEQNTLHFIYHDSNPLPGSISLAEDLWWGGDFEVLLERFKQGEIHSDQLKFFIGYSGWAAGQLDNELEEDTWIICTSADYTEIFDDSAEEMWRVILKNMGGEYQQMANYPIDPRLN